MKTGDVRLEGKSTLNYVLGQRMTSGMDWMQAAYGIDENLTEEGPFLKDNLDVIRAAGQPTLREVARYAFISAGNNLKTIYQVLLRSNAFGSPLLMALVIVGLFRSIWNRERFLYEGFFALFLISICLILLSVQQLWERYAFPLLPFLVLWASKGIAELSDWITDTAASVGLMFFKDGRATRYAAQCALSISLLAFATTAYITDLKRARSHIDPVKEAGLWLGQFAGGPNRVMSSSSVFAYYSGGTWLPLPYSESTLALKYIHRKQPNFIVLASEGSGTRPYLRQWMESGIQDHSAKLIYDKASFDGERIKIYQWTSQVLESMARAGKR
jgi:hypothetical protein